MLAQVKELVTQVAKSTTGFGEVRIIYRKGSAATGDNGG